MTVSRDFIDSYSPEAPRHRARQGALVSGYRRSQSSLPRAVCELRGRDRSPDGPASADCGATTLVFGFHAVLAQAESEFCQVEFYASGTRELHAAAPGSDLSS